MQLYFSGDDNDPLLIENDISGLLNATLNDNTRAELCAEVSAYLRTKTDKNFEELTKYPTIEKLFMKYNCIRSSEAICERMFSYAGELSYEVITLSEMELSRWLMGINIYIRLYRSMVFIYEA